MIVAESGELFLDLVRCTEYYNENALRIAGLWVETGTLDLPNVATCYSLDEAETSHLRHSRLSPH